MRSRVETDPSPPAWTQPYLETCCRSALHRLLLCDAGGRPAGLKDGPCLARLAGMGLAETTAAASGERYRISPAGRARHAQEICGTSNR